RIDPPPLTLVVFSPHRSAVNTSPSKITEAELSSAAWVKCLLQIRRLRGQYRESLVDVAVSCRPRYPVVAAQGGDLRTLAEPAQHQHRMPETAQRPRVCPGTTPNTLS